MPTALLEQTPIDYTTTKELTLDAVGAQRQLKVPCGYEIVAKSDSGSVMISALIEYETDACEL
jgi:hypothetical protein